VAAEEEQVTNSVSFTTKEMLVRMDGKLDSVLNRQAHYDVELALLKARVEVNEHALGGVGGQLSEAKNLMATEVSNIKKGQVTLNRTLKYATATVVTAVVVVDAAIRFFK
jgi:hypothetical protein